MISIRFDQSAMNRAFAEMEKQVRFAASLAINRTAQEVKRELQGEMRSIFDRPTSFTMGSLRIIPATKQKLEATVWFKNPPRLGDSQHYLEPQVYGGQRPIKRFERWLQVAGHLPAGWFAVPGPAARLDGHGNMSRGQIVQILSGLRAMPNPDANRPHQYGLTRGSRVRRNMPVFVVIRPGGKLQPGVWQRGENRTFHQVLAFVQRVFYRKRFKFAEVAQRVVERELARQFDKALQEARATAW